MLLDLVCKLHQTKQRILYLIDIHSQNLFIYSNAHTQLHATENILSMTLHIIITSDCDNTHNGWEGGESEALLFFPQLEVLTVYTPAAMRMCSNVRS